MIITPIHVDGAYLIELNKLSDERGFFARAFCSNEFSDQGLKTNFVQANLSGNNQKNTVRGLHMQKEPHSEVKLVRCIRGAIFDAFVDLRPNSPTFGKWAGAELTQDNRKMLYIPEGCAHGYQTLCDDTEVMYMVSAFYHAESERGYRWDDPSFGIDWPEKQQAILSEKDKAWPLYETK